MVADIGDDINVSNDCAFERLLSDTSEEDLKLGEELMAAFIRDIKLVSDVSRVCFELVGTRSVKGLFCALK